MEEQVIGRDVEELFKVAGEREHSFTHGDKKWTFKFRTLSWGEHYQIVENSWGTAQDPTTGDLVRNFDFSGYYEQVLMLVITQMPDGSVPSLQVIRQLSSTVVTQLVTSGLVPSPLLQVEEEAIKKD